MSTEQQKRFLKNVALLKKKPKNRLDSLIVLRPCLQNGPESGPQKKYPDAAVIADLVTDRKINVQSPVNQNFIFPVSLDRGEKDALLLAREIKNSLLATDDHNEDKGTLFPSLNNFSYFPI